MTLDFESLYQTADPWGLKDSLHFSASNRIIKSKIESVNFSSCFDVGCGEGTRLKALGIVQDVYGLDLSPTAIRRCTRLIPRGTFIIGDIKDSSILPTVPMDLIMAHDVLYYQPESLDTILENIKSLGRATSTFIITFPVLNSINGSTSGLSLSTITSILEKHFVIKEFFRVAAAQRNFPIFYRLIFKLPRPMVPLELKVRLYLKLLNIIDPEKVWKWGVTAQFREHNQPAPSGLTPG